MISFDMARVIGDPDFTAREASYAWVVDYDHLDEKPTSVTGPHNAPAGLLAQLGDGDGLEFQLYDGDGMLFYSGRYLGPDDDSTFGPLDDWGTNAGATEIRYRNDDGEFEEL